MNSADKSTLIANVNPRLDRLDFGITGRLIGGRYPDVQRFREALENCDEVRLVQQGDDARLVRFAVLLHDEEDRKVGEALVDMHFVERGDDLQSSNRSRVRINPLRVTRGLLGADRAGPLSLDEKENVVSPAAFENVGVEQSELVGEAFSVVLSAISQLMPGSWESGKTWLKAAELCADIEIDDAIAAARELQRFALGSVLNKASGRAALLIQGVGGGTLDEQASLLAGRRELVGDQAVATDRPAWSAPGR